MSFVKASSDVSEVVAARLATPGDEPQAMLTSGDVSITKNAVYEAAG